MGNPLFEQSARRGPRDRAVAIAGEAGKYGQRRDRYGRQGSAFEQALARPHVCAQSPAEYLKAVHLPDMKTGGLGSARFTLCCRRLGCSERHAACTIALNASKRFAVQRKNETIFSDPLVLLRRDLEFARRLRRLCAQFRRIRRAGLRHGRRRRVARESLIRQRSHCARN